MKYKGIELVDISDTPHIFDPPKTMLAWDDGMTVPNELSVCAILPNRIRTGRVVCYYNQAFTHCAEIPEEPKSRRATWKELAYWLMDAKGLVFDNETGKIDTGVYFSEDCIDDYVYDRLKVMRRDDTDWHEPTVDYMGIKESK